MNNEELELLQDELEDDLDDTVGMMTEELQSLDPTKETREYLAFTEIRMNLHRIVEFSINYALEIGKQIRRDLERKKEEAIEFSSKDSNNQIKIDKLAGLKDFLKSNSQRPWRISHIQEFISVLDIKSINSYLEMVQNPSGFITESHEKETLYEIIEKEFNKASFNNKTLNQKFGRNNLQENIFTRNQFNKFELPYEDFIVNNYKYKTINQNELGVDGFTGFVRLDFDNIKNLYEIGIIEEIILNNQTSYTAIANKVNSNEQEAQLKLNLDTSNLCGIIKYNNSKLLPSDIFQLKYLNTILLGLISKYVKVVALEGSYEKTDIILKEVVKLFNQQELPKDNLFNYNINYANEELVMIQEKYSNQPELTLFKPFIITIKNNGILFLNDLDLFQNQSMEELLQKVSTSKYDFLTQSVGKKITTSFIGLNNYTKITTDNSKIRLDATTVSLDVGKKNLEELSFGDVKKYTNKEITANNLANALATEKDPYVRFALIYLDKAQDKYCAEPGKLDINKDYVALKVKNLLEINALNYRNLKNEVKTLPPGRYSIATLEEKIVENTMPTKKLFLEFLYDLLDKVIDETKIEHTYPRKELAVLEKEFSYIVDNLDKQGSNRIEVINSLNRVRKRPAFVKELSKGMYFFLLANTYLNLVLPELNTSNILEYITPENRYSEFEKLPKTNLKQIIEERVDKLSKSEFFSYNSIILPEINFMRDAMNPKSRNVVEYKLVFFSYYLKKILEVISQIRKETEEFIGVELGDFTNESKLLKVNIKGKEDNFATDLLSEKLTNYFSKVLNAKGILDLDLEKFLDILPTTIRKHTFQQDYNTTFSKDVLESSKEVVAEIQLEKYNCNFFPSNNKKLLEEILNKEELVEKALILSDNTDFVNRLLLFLEKKNSSYLDTVSEEVGLTELLETTDLKERIRVKFEELLLIKEGTVTKSDLINVAYVPKNTKEEEYLDYVAILYAKLIFTIYDSLIKENVVSLIQRIVDSKSEEGIINEKISLIINKKIKEGLQIRFTTDTEVSNQLDKIISDSIDKLLQNKLLKNYIISGVKIKDSKTIIEGQSQIEKMYNLFINRIQFLPISGLSYLNKRKVSEARERELEEKRKSKELDFPNKDVMVNMVNSLYDLYLQTGLKQPLERLENITIPNLDLTGFDLISPLLLTQGSKPTYKLEGTYSAESLYKNYADDLLAAAEKLPENERTNLSYTYNLGASFTEVINDTNRGTDSYYNAIRQIDITQFVLDIEKYLDSDYVEKLPVSLRKYLEEDTFIYLQRNKEDTCPYLGTKLKINIREETGETLLNANSLSRELGTL